MHVYNNACLNVGDVTSRFPPRSDGAPREPRAERRDGHRATAPTERASGSSVSADRTKRHRPGTRACTEGQKLESQQHSEGREGYYGTRRKRNVKLRGVAQQERTAEQNNRSWHLRLTCAHSNRVRRLQFASAQVHTRDRALGSTRPALRSRGEWPRSPRPALRGRAPTRNDERERRERRESRVRAAQRRACGSSRRGRVRAPKLATFARRACPAARAPLTSAPRAAFCTTMLFCTTTSRDSKQTARPPANPARDTPRRRLVLLKWLLF